MIKIAAWPNPSAARHWRLEAPFKYLNHMGEYDARIIDGPITDEVAAWADIYVLHGIVDREGIATLHAYQKEQGKKLIIEQDDLIEVDEHNPHAKDHEVKQAAETIKITMGIADAVTTTTKPLARRLRHYNSNVIVLPNYLDMETWDLPIKKVNTSGTIRIGWAGSITHLRDLDMVAPVLRRIMSEYPKVELVLVGEPRARKLFEGYKVEVMYGVPFEAWPAKLHSLRLDMGIAPLQATEFNKAKSNIKFLEYSIAKVPGVYSKTVYCTNKIEPNRGMIAYDMEQWYACLRNLIVSPALREDMRLSAYSFVRSWYDLETHTPERDKAYKSLLA